MTQPDTIRLLTEAQIKNPSSVPRQTLDKVYIPGAAGYDIFIAAGQSNMVGYSDLPPFLSVTDPVNPKIDQWGTHGTLGIKPATEPLDMYVAGPGIGPALQFARWYAARRLASNRKVLIIPAAKGGTPFEGVSGPPGFTWKIGRTDVTNVYDNMVTQINAAKTAADSIPNTTNVFAGFLWLQGESDGDNNTSGPTYRADLEALLASVRTVTATPNLPIVIGTMVPEYLSTGTRKVIDAVHRNTPLRIAKSDVAVSAVGMNKGDGNHFNEAGQRFNGRAFYDAYERIVQGLAPTFTNYAMTTPAAPTLTNDTTTTLTVAWVGVTNALSYIVEYKVTGAANWTALASTTNTVVTLTGLTNGTSYDVRVTGYNLIGDASTPSAASTKVAADAPNIVLDSFTRADSTNILGTADTGQVWSTATGTWGITGNKAYVSAATGDDRATVETGVNDQRVTATVTGTAPGSTGPNIGLMARVVDNSNAYAANITQQTSQAKLFKQVGGVFTQIGATATAQFADGDTVSLAVKGSTITLYRNGVALTSVVDTTHAAGTKAGMRMAAGSATLRFDDFRVQAA